MKERIGYLRFRLGYHASTFRHWLRHPEQRHLFRSPFTFHRAMTFAEYRKCGELVDYAARFNGTTSEPEPTSSPASDQG